MTASRWKASLLVGALLLAACGGDDDADDTTSTDESSTDDTSSTEDTASDNVTDDTEVDDTDGTEPPTSSDDGTAEPSEPAEESDGDEPSVLNARFAADPTALDPLYVANYTDIALAGSIHEALVEFGPDGELTNVLADTWEVAPDGLSIDFTLKQGIQFHGGYGEMTMEDVQFAIERAAGLIQVEGAEETSATAFYTELDRVETVDDYTGRIILKAPSVPLLQQALPLTGIVSKAAFDDRGFAELQTNPIGTGPYQFEEAVPGEFVRLSNFEEYAGQAPWVSEDRYDEITYRIIPEDSAAELAFEAGDIDLLAPMRAAAVDRFTALDGTEILEGSGMQYRFIGMNMIDPALSNPDLRRAIIAAIDVPSIIAATSEGRDVRATALVAPSAPIGYWADAPVHEQDLDEARRLVELVPEEDRTLRFTISDDEMSRTVAQVAQANLADAGLTVEIEILDPATFFVADETNRERQLFYTEYGINYQEPSQELIWFTCDQFDIWNYMYFCDENYDRLFAEAAVEIDDAARNDIYVEMQEIWEDAASTVWVSHPTVFVAARNVDVAVDPSGTVYLQSLAPR